MTKPKQPKKVPEHIQFINMLRECVLGYGPLPGTPIKRDRDKKKKSHIRFFEFYERGRDGRMRLRGQVLRCRRFDGPTHHEDDMSEAR